jgi:hypothetical protein
LLIESLGKGNIQEDKVFDEVIKKPGGAGQNLKVKPEILMEEFHSKLATAYS